MQSVEAKLAEWAELYGQLQAARARLKVAKAPGVRVSSDLEVDVLDLQRKCGVALDELNAEYARHRGKA